MNVACSTVRAAMLRSRRASIEWAIIQSGQTNHPDAQAQYRHADLFLNSRACVTTGLVPAIHAMILTRKAVAATQENRARPDVETSAPARQFKPVIDGPAGQSLIVKEPQRQPVAIISTELPVNLAKVEVKGEQYALDILRSPLSREWRRGMATY